MSATYRGRHSAAAPRKLFARALRPLASVAAITAVAGVSTAESFHARPMLVGQSTELSQKRVETDVARSEENRSAMRGAAALKRQQRARRAQQRALTAALLQARAAAARGVARQKVRQGLLAQARSDPRAAGRVLAAGRGWEGQQLVCLNSLWERESGWRWNASNSSSGAYGIPQALPGSKMSSFGSDWASNPITQMKWGLSYISKSYGTPCSAWAQSQAVNWY